MKPFILAIVIVFWSWGSSLNAEPIRVGVSLPLTGDGATYGDDGKRVVQFANKKLADSRYELLFEDDKCTGKDAVSVAHKFAGIERVGFVLGPACSGALLSAAPIYEKAKVVVMGIGVSAPAVSEAGDYIFRYSTNDAIAARGLYEYVAKQGHRSLAVLSEETEYCQAFRRVFETAGKGSTMRQVQQSYLPGTTDFRATLLKLKSNGVGGLFINTQAEGALINIVKQVRELKWEVALYGAYYGSSPTFLDALGRQAAGLVFVDLPAPESLFISGGQGLYSQFISEFGPLKSNPIYFVLVFEAFRAMHQALSSGQDSRRYLYQTEFDGIAGKYRFDNNGDVVGLPLAIKVIRGGKPELLEQIRY